MNLVTAVLQCALERACQSVEVLERASSFATESTITRSDEDGESRIRRISHQTR